MRGGALDRRVTIEYPVSTPDPTYGTPVIMWTLLAVIWASVKDETPALDETIREGLAASVNRTRVRYRYRTDVTSAMRMTVGGSVNRVLQIVGGPAEIGRRYEFCEVVCEAASS